MQSEQGLQERLRKELLNVKNVEFPKDTIRPTDVKDLNAFFPLIVVPIPGQVCYRPLYFEDKRTERFGQYVPCVQPLISTARFYGNVLILPYRIYAAAPWRFECDNR